MRVMLGRSREAQYSSMAAAPPAARAQNKKMPTSQRVSFFQEKLMFMAGQYRFFALA